MAIDPIVKYLKFKLRFRQQTCKFTRKGHLIDSNTYHIPIHICCIVLNLNKYTLGQKLMKENKCTCFLCSHMNAKDFNSRN